MIGVIWTKSLKKTVVTERNEAIPKFKSKIKNKTNGIENRLQEKVSFPQIKPRMTNAEILNIKLTSSKRIAFKINILLGR